MRARATFGIGFRIAASYALILCVLAIAGWVGYVGLYDARGLFGEVDAANRNVIRAAQLNADFQELRRLVQAHAARAGTDLHERIAERATILGVDLERLESTQTAPGVRAALSRLLPDYQRYRDSTQKIIELRRNYADRVDGRLEPAALTARQVLTAAFESAVTANAPALVRELGRAQDNLGIARVRIARFLADPTQAYMLHALEALEALNENLISAREAAVGASQTLDDAVAAIAPLPRMLIEAGDVALRIEALMRINEQDLADTIGQNLD